MSRVPVARSAKNQTRIRQTGKQKQVPEALNQK